MPAGSQIHIYCIGRRASIGPRIGAYILNFRMIQIRVSTQMTVKSTDVRQSVCGCQHLGADIASAVNRTPFSCHTDSTSQSAGAGIGHIELSVFVKYGVRNKASRIHS